MPLACISALFLLNTSKKSPSAPVFSAERFSPLSCHKLNAVTRHLLQQAELNQSDYSSHSFGIEAATTAAAAGIPTWLVMKLCRWTSNAYRSYIHCPTITTSAIPKIFSRTGASKPTSMQCRSIACKQYNHSYQ